MDPFYLGNPGGEKSNKKQSPDVELHHQQWSQLDSIKASPLLLSGPGVQAARPSLEVPVTDISLLGFRGETKTSQPLRPGSA